MEGRIQPIYRRNLPRTESYIGIKLTMPGLAARLLKNWQAVGSLTSSAHRVIEITLRWDGIETAQAKKNSRFNSRKVNCEKFKREFRN